jgi:hypothetical protein
MPKKRKTKRTKLERVSIRAELRAEPDWDRYAFAVLQLARKRYAATLSAKPSKGDGDGP